MRILITSGGTTVPIDPVRYISNSSTGKFGAELASCALRSNADVTYLTSATGKSPFSCNMDLYTSTDWENNLNKLKQLNQFCDQYRSHYQEYRYHHFQEYAELLKSIVEKDQPDIIILAAAVSDYLISNYSDKKVRSKENLTIHFQSAPKLIHFIRQWSEKSFIVGFKLLVNATDAELVTAAKDSMAQHDTDLVVANDLSSIKRGAHEIILVERNGSSQKHTQNLAEAVIKRSLQR